MNITDLKPGMIVEGDKESSSYHLTDLHKIKRAQVINFNERFANVILMDIESPIRAKADGAVDSIAAYNEVIPLVNEGDKLCVSIDSICPCKYSLSRVLTDETMLIFIGKKRKEKLKPKKRKSILNKLFN